jgi:MoxR-like ATPase
MTEPEAVKSIKLVKSEPRTTDEMLEQIDTLSARKLKGLALRLAAERDAVLDKANSFKLALAALAIKYDSQRVEDEDGTLVSAELHLPERKTLRLPATMTVDVRDAPRGAGVVMVRHVEPEAT